MPPGPVAATADRSTPRSLASLRTGGLASTAGSVRRAPSPARGPAVAPVGAPTAAGAADSAAGGEAGRAARPPVAAGAAELRPVAAGAAALRSVAALPEVPAGAGAVWRRRRATGASFVP